MAAIEGLTVTQNVDLQGVNVGDLIFVEKVEYDSDDDAEYESDEENESDRDEDGDEYGDDSSSTSDDDESDADDGESVKPTMYIIVSITKDADEIVDISIAPLAFSDKVGAQYGGHNYHIFGDRCGASHECDETCPFATSIKQVASDASVFLVSPTGDYIRSVIMSPRRCLDTCTNGFLDSLSCLSDMVENYTPEMLVYEQSNAGVVPAFLEKPLCPVCIGPGLLQEQQGLQHDLLVNNLMRFTAIVDYHGMVAARRNALGYQFVQFDERRWGMAFGDMLSEDQDGYDDGEYEHWAEAQDPNAIVNLQPASKETIAALPRKKRSEVTFQGEDELCPIDLQSFESDCTLLQLSCGHKYHEECLVQWLRHHNTCPVCREVVPDVNGEQEGKARPEVTSAAMRMSLQEALTSLGSAEDADFDAVDQEMLPLIFESARVDRPGWRTETAIARIQAEITLRAADAEENEADGAVPIQNENENKGEDEVMADE
ncbi:E3 ubiquitin-protein ligase RING1 [Cercospora beticola]|uniref:E3 ubiquitin-protein ligase RING1 n=1 Tax=Cercospora beticola TaxID=122368 RepID=A0A2G5HPC0_CERBT|nr:E3 ubiquitin-protein ligase RING1 [Cercospora beticola]PIA94395.1 E3 ubiquitin-protein ligase RING1 [Cercospora beticola]WPB05296.1 hypothetical protein RHO25_009948 [Cercospora beticola]CAK1365095.1 unnamed protein product [Cercospora beticola]